MRTRAFLSVVLILISIRLNSQTTWNQDIAPIMYENCTGCHHTGGIAPYSLMSYAEAVTHGIDIKNNVVDGIMPPWPPDENYVHFKDERVLSADQIDKIVDWASDGFQEGAGAAPIAPVYTDEIVMTDYDLALDLPTYTIPVDEDVYRTFVIHSGLTETKYINASEFIPDNASVIHHMLIYSDTSDVSWEYDQADPGPGYASNGTTTSSPSAKLIGAWAPGDNVYQLPVGMGIEVPAGSDFAIEIHFAPEHEGESATPSLHLKWSDAAFTRPVWIDPILYHYAPCFQEPLFYIPANTITTFHEIYSDDTYLNINLSLISAAPHMHYLGTTFRAYAKTPENDSIPLIYIDNWNFHWQYGYTFQKLVKIPAFTDFYGIATYDNTSANEDNPNDPPQGVWLGEQTTDEMMLCFFAYTFYLPGDENMILDSSLLETSVIDQQQELQFVIYPNPANNVLNIANEFIGSNNYDILITDMLGNILLEEEMDNSATKSIPIDALPEGIYMIQISDGSHSFNDTFIKANSD